LGLGVNPPQMSWGSLLSDGKAVIDIAWHLSFFPGLMIFIITFCLIQISDYLQNIANKKDKTLFAKPKIYVAFVT
jgi:peptide/nickel transport system permease protein